MKRGIACFVVLLCGFSCAALAAPNLEVSDSVWDAGIIVTGGSYEKKVIITNVGDEPLVVENIEECCGFFGKVEGRSRLLPGETASLSLSLHPFKFVGDLKAEMFIISNDPKQPRYSVFAKAQVVPKDHALGALKEREDDLGILDQAERMPFRVRILNSGNAPLEIRQVETPQTVTETGHRPVVAGGSEEVLNFVYTPTQQGPIEDKISIITNDALRRVLVFQVKGYVSRGRVPDHALCIYPVGKKAPYDVMNKAFRYDFTINNAGSVGIEILKAESSLPTLQLEVPRSVGPGTAAEATATLPLKEGTVGKGFIYLHLAIPVEAQ